MKDVKEIPLRNKARRRIYMVLVVVDDGTDDDNKDAVLFHQWNENGSLASVEQCDATR